MSLSQVLTLIEQARDERGIHNWHKLSEYQRQGLTSYGIGLTKLRKLAKQIGRDHALSQLLWQTDIYDAKVISLLIDEPAKLTMAHAEEQVDQLASGMLVHVFSSCDATLAKTPFVVELASRWFTSLDVTRRDCAYGLLYEISKFKGKKSPDDAFFLSCIERINSTIDSEPKRVRLAMGTALMGIGKRNVTLNQAALDVATRVGPIEFDSASGQCEPFDVVKHLLRAKAVLNA